MRHLPRSGARRRDGRSCAPRFAEHLEPRTLLAFSPLGPEFRVNTTTFQAQGAPAAAADADGDFVLVWDGYTPDTNSIDVFAQRYSAAGAPLGGEFRINTTLPDHQGGVAVASDADGDFVVTWGASDGIDIGVYGRRFSAAGLPLGGEFPVNDVTFGQQGAQAVAMDADGDFVVVWTGSGVGDDQGIYARRFNASGQPLGGQFIVNTFRVGQQREPSVAMDGDGDFVVVWNSLDQDGSLFGVYAQRYNAAGVPQGGEFRVNTTTAGDQFSGGSVTMAHDGSFVVPWHGPRADGIGLDVYFQRYNAAGVAQGGEVRANATLPGDQYWAWASADADGDFLVMWQSNGQDGSGFGVYAQRFSAAGVPLGGEFRANSFTVGAQWLPVAAVDDDGDAVIGWQSDNQDGSLSGVYAQRYDETSDTAGPVVGGVVVHGRSVVPGQQVPAAVQGIAVSFSERMSTLGGAAGADSVTNVSNWRLTKDGTDVSSSIRSVTFSFNAATRKYEAVLGVSPLVAGSYVLTARDAMRDVAANALDGDVNGSPGGDFGLPFVVVNEPPTTIGIPSVTVAEDQEDTAVNLFDAFADGTDAGADLTYSVTGNTNPGLFGAVRLDPAAGTLLLGYAPNANGEASITVRATDTGGSFVETTFTVTVLAVNDPPVNTVPAQQFAVPGAPVVFRARDGNAVSVNDVDDAGGGVTVVLETGRRYSVEVVRSPGVVVSSEPGVVRLTGPIAGVNAAMDGMRLVPDGALAETTTLRITTTDTGTGVGGPLGDSDTVLVTFDERQSGVSIGDVTVAEGNSGFADATFTVRRTGARTREAAVSFATSDGTAREGADYGPVSGRIVFAPDQTEATITVRVYGELRHEADETFFVTLSDPSSGITVTDDEAVGTIVNDDAPEPPPAVTQVFVSGTTWTAAFKNYLAAQGLGDATYGYAVPAGAAQLAVLPWGSINQVSVRFSRDVLVLDLDLAVRGVNVLNYPVADFTYDGANTATWTLSRGIRNDKLMLDLDGGPDGIVDDAGVLLDGNWSNGADTYPSGDGAAGGDLRFRLNVVAGDVTRSGRVDANDWMQLRLRQRRSTAAPGAGTTAYSVFHDLDGSGVIDTYDMLHARRNLLRALPGAEPAGSVAGTAPAAHVAGSSITREVFSRRGVLV